MYMIEGEWSGYRSSQQRIVHRHYVSSSKEADAIRAIGYSIQYTDGTELILTVRKVRKQTQPEILGYRSLIDDCARLGVSSVAALAKSRAMGAKDT